MKKSTLGKRIAIVAIVLSVIFVFGISGMVVGISGMMLIRPDIMAEILPYSVVKQYLLYDHITYNGVNYYLMDHAPVHEGKFITDDSCVVLVNQNGVPYEEDQKESAWLLANDPDELYIYFNSAYYTRDKSRASEMYGFNN